MTHSPESRTCPQCGGPLSADGFLHLTRAKVAAIRNPHRQGDLHNYGWNDAVTACLRAVGEAFRDASRATPRPEGLDAEWLHPDDGHAHSWGCRRCGVDPGPLAIARLSDTGERPTPDLSSAAGQPLNPDQVESWPDHAAMSCDER